MQQKFKTKPWAEMENIQNLVASERVKERKLLNFMRVGNRIESAAIKWSFLSRPIQ